MNSKELNELWRLEDESLEREHKAIQNKYHAHGFGYFCSKCNKQPINLQSSNGMQCSCGYLGFPAFQGMRLQPYEFK